MFQHFVMLVVYLICSNLYMWVSPNNCVLEEEISTTIDLLSVRTTAEERCPSVNISDITYDVGISI